MTLLLFVLNLGLLLPGNMLILRLLKKIHTWPHRRALQGLVLALPLLSLGMGMSVWCWHHLALSWMAWMAFVPWFLALLITIGAAVMGSIRLLLVHVVLARYHGHPAEPLQTTATALLEKRGLARVRVLQCEMDQPLALTWGFLRPTIFLSTWMLDHLDSQELEAVLLHEMQHIAQRDCLLLWLATMLRDAFFYLPTSRQAYRALQAEKELICDDLVIHVTRRPLALASALTKVWLYALERGTSSRSAGIPSIEGERVAIHTRIERLRQSARTMRSETAPQRPVDRSSSGTLLLVFQLVGLFVLLTFLSCGTLILFLPML